MNNDNKVVLLDDTYTFNKAGTSHGPVYKNGRLVNPAGGVRIGTLNLKTGKVTR